MKIIYINDEGGVSVIHPTQEALDLYGIETIAIKDVPAGLVFKIVEDDCVPDTREARNAWVVDPIELTDGVGGDASSIEIKLDR